MYTIWLNFIFSFSPLWVLFMEQIFQKRFLSLSLKMSIVIKGDCLLSWEGCCLPLTHQSPDTCLINFPIGKRFLCRLLPPIEPCLPMDQQLMRMCSEMNSDEHWTVRWILPLPFIVTEGIPAWSPTNVSVYWRLSVLRTTKINLCFGVT